ncbi:Maf-like protein [Hanseniaspora osmophila]|uniref:Maf-like protein n=1 Tax=Hanseniaspora osmophila TaxID=56408 RepID=A0A1E5RNB3_9ASCO|nr:Maf-like protein [Hanseniaspora osmophila]
MVHSHLITKIHSKYDVILGSSSPRRREIITKNIGFQNDKVKIMKPSFEENLNKGLYLEDLYRYAKDTVKHKAMSLIPDLEKEYCETKASLQQQQQQQQQHDEILVICCDTTLVDPVDGIIYEKPKDREDQLQNLQKFCYVLHELKCVSSVCIMLYCPSTKKYETHEFNSITSIIFDENIPKSILQDYVNSGEASDAAGGFKIQETAATFIKSIEGDFFNVMGFPVNKTVQELIKIIDG